MDFGLFVEFPCQEGGSEYQAFADCFALVHAAEACGVASVWLAEYHFSQISVLSAPITIASAIAAQTATSVLGWPSSCYHWGILSVWPKRLPPWITSVRGA